MQVFDWIWNLIPMIMLFALFMWVYNLQGRVEELEHHLESLASSEDSHS